jgi:cryptochrome
VNLVSFEKDLEAIWRKRDDLVKEVCKRNAVQVIEMVSHTLYDPEEIFNLNNDMPPNTCEELRKFCYRIGRPEKPVPMIDLKFISSNLASTDDVYEARLHQVPTVDFFGMKPECKEQETCRFEGGELPALKLCKKRIEYEIEWFKKGKINQNLSKPVLLDQNVSLSPYLRFGCLSVRKFYWDLRRAFEKVSPR